MFANIYLLLLVIATAYAADDDDRLLYVNPPLVPRASWKARLPEGNLPNNSLPVEEVIVHHTGAEECLEPAECQERVRAAQTYYLDAMGLDDIPYNFLIGGDGNVYVGRGWSKVGDPTVGLSQGTLGVAFVGYYDRLEPNADQIDAFLKLMTMGVSLGKISTSFVLLGQCQVMDSASPGQALMDLISEFPSFDHSRNCTDVFNTLYETIGE